VVTPISTGCAPLDTLLGGGVERGAITQVYGPPAAGKTNIALSTTAEAVVAGEPVVYIDTEGVSTARLEQILEPRATADGLDTDMVADRIIFKEPHDFDAQRAAVKETRALADEAGLIVLDSATGFYRLRRTDDTEDGEALRAVADQLTLLLSLARQRDLAVLITNQVYTDPEGDRAQPLGGHTLAHWVGTTLRIDRFRGGKRRATLEKHRSQAVGETETFQIVEDGLTATR